jgi:hypothetical protein
MCLKLSTDPGSAPDPPGAGPGTFATTCRNWQSCPCCRRAIRAGWHGDEGLASRARDRPGGRGGPGRGRADRRSGECGPRRASGTGQQRRRGSGRDRRVVRRGPGRGHRQAAVEPRPEHRAADGQHHQGDDRLPGDQGGPPGPPDHRPGRGDRVRARARRQQRRPAAGGPAHRAPAPVRAAAPVRRGRRLHPGQGLRPRPDRVRRPDERDGAAAGHEPDALQQLRRAALPDLVLQLLHRREPAHPGPRRHAAPDVPLGRGPAQLPPRRRLRASRLPVEEPQLASRPLSGRDRHQARLHRRRRPVPALRSVPARSHHPRRHPAQPRLHHQHQHRRRDPHPELGFQPSW